MTIVEDVLGEPLELGWYTVPQGSIRYRAIEAGDVRYGWTLLPRARPVSSGGMVPKHHALVLRRSPAGGWRLEEHKAFESSGDAEHWVRGLWHDAGGATRPAPG